MTASTDISSASQALPRDASLRHVLPADAPYLRNLAALWAAEPGLARQIEALEGTVSYPVQPSKAGPPTVSVPSPGGRAIWLHSRYEPLEEARRLIEPI